ncbi:hypothetical protein ACFOND_03210 [Reinekea marina]|uniref:Uncharacterized protein n=2 Tax=Reinekea marina TaxID=1310421 RepID=A0ABV7WPC7_9GAMM
MESNDEDLGFSCQITKNGRVFFVHLNRPAGVLSGKEASRFMAKFSQSNFQQQQLLMAKATGHYKHGNEKQSKKR